ncbi:MAG: hypothetical protein COY39_02490 [Alphaproteobacteria bacterium CG_4_10_14_0_8_um_filter_37_21]|nr:MAG: hypothetical protein COY39_02490 [Alphaproteobacteria bacterium CG_4_10_14_0_8_um_filter_37_21]
MINFLKRQEVIYASFFIAGIVAYYFPNTAKMFETPGDLYLSLFQMCILPLVVSSIILSAASIIEKRNQKLGSGAILSFFLFGMILSGVLGLALPTILNLGKAIATDPAFLEISGGSQDDLIASVMLTTPIETVQGIGSIIASIFTKNIFTSLGSAAILQLIPVAFLIGSAAAFLPTNKKEMFLSFVSAIDLIFKQIITCIILLLPFGIVLTFSSKFQTLSLDLLMIFLPCLVLMLGSMVFCCVLFTFLIAKKTQLTYMQVLSRIKETLIVLTGTASFISAMPFYMKALKENFHCDEDKVDLFIPITIPIFRFGNVFHFAFIAILATQIFSIPLSLYEYFLLIILTVFAGFSSVSSGLINIGLLGIVLSPVSVPFSLMIVLFAILEPIIDPIRTIFGLYVNFLCSIFGFSRGEIGKTGK